MFTVNAITRCAAISLCPPTHDILPLLTVDGCVVVYNDQIIYVATSYEEAICYRDRHLNLYA